MSIAVTFPGAHVLGAPAVSSGGAVRKLTLLARFARWSLAGALSGRESPFDSDPDSSWRTRGRRIASSIADVIAYARLLREPVPIVWIASASKSGNTWLRYLLYHAAYNKARSVGPEDAIPHWAAFFHRVRRRALRTTAGQQFVLIKTHARPLDPAVGCMPFLMPFTVGAVYLYRNPKDVCLSQINHMRLAGRYARESDAQLAFRFLNGQLFSQEGPWVDHIQAWQRVTEFPVITLRYEDLKASTPECLARILEFLGEPADPDRVVDAVRLSDIRRMRAREEQRGDGFGYRRIDGDPSRRFINGGRSDQSLAHLGDDLVDAFERRYGEAMTRFGYRRTEADVEVNR
jgi:hypothetical protein